MWDVVKAALRALPKYKVSLSMYIILNVLLIGLGVVQPYLYKQSIDGLVKIVESTNASPQVALITLIGLWLGVTYVLDIVRNIKNWIFWQKLSNPMFIDYLRNAYGKMLNFQYDFFVKKKAGEVMKVLDDGVEAYSSLVDIAFEQLLLPILSFFALLIFAWSQSKELTLVCLIILPIQAAWGYYSYQKAAPLSKKSRKKWHDLFGYIGDVLNNVLTTKSFHQEKREIKKMDKVSEEAIYYANKSHTVWVMFDMLDINTLSQGAIILSGYLLIKNGQITVGTLLMFTTILNQLLVPIRMIKSNIRNIQTNSIQYKKLQDMLKLSPLMIVPQNGYTQKTVSGRITFKNISFGYSKDHTTLSRISLDILPGEKVALVGRSGAGKSTLALLLMRFYDVNKGAICLDGIDIRDWDYENLRSHFGVVWQENMLFHDTILNNIRYSKPDASKEDVIVAAKQAHAHDYIQMLAKQYQSVVGERGIRLSGGEKQRVAIARALLKNPRIVILDEATSALDSITEHEVQKGIQNLIADRTAVIIAHRLSTVQHCDKIVLIDQGEIIAVGKHAELLRSNKQYREMVDLQMNGFFSS